MRPLIAHIRACNFFGGPERQITGHAGADREFRHLVITFLENNRANELFEHCRANNIAVTAIATRHSFEFATILRLRAILAAAQPAIICCHGYKPLILSLIAKCKLNRPLIAFCRGHTGENLKVRFFEYLEHKSLPLADVVVAVSQGYANYLSGRGLSPEHLRVVPNAIDVNKFTRFVKRREQKRRELGFTENEFLIATAGRLSPEKAQKDLLRAFQQVRRNFSETRLLLCGEGPSRVDLESLVKDKAINDVHFLGFRPDLDEIMPAIDLFVLPSLTEGLPNVILEAAACRRPIVATAVGGVPEVVEHGKSGVLVPPGQPGLLAEAITACLQDYARSQAMGEAAANRVKTGFSFAAQAKKSDEVYLEVLRAEQMRFYIEKLTQK